MPLGGPDSSWPDFLGVHDQAIVAAAALAVSVVGWLVDRWARRKRLSYRVEHDHSITLAPASVGQMEKLGVKYADTEIKDPRLVLLRIKNSGSGDIKRTDFVHSSSSSAKATERRSSCGTRDTCPATTASSRQHRSSASPGDDHL